MGIAIFILPWVVIIAIVLFNGIKRHLIMQRMKEEIERKMQDRDNKLART